MGNALELTVNFDHQVIALFKEVRNLVWLNYQIPHAINTVSKDAKRVYPFAVSLMESVRSFSQTIRVIESMPQVAMLLNNHVKEVQSLVQKGAALKWESFVHSYDLHIQQQSFKASDSIRPGPTGRAESKHVQFVKDFATVATTLQTKASKLQEIHSTVSSAMAALEDCSYTASAFATQLDIVQTAVDQLNLENYSNLRHWVKGINDTVKDVLTRRMRNALQIWIDAFSNSVVRGAESHNARTRSTLDSSQDLEQPRLPHLVHEVCMRNQIIYLDPPVEFARASWLSQLHQWLGIACDLPLIVSSRYEMNINTLSTRDRQQRFTTLPRLCALDVIRAYEAIEKRVAEVTGYVDKWLQFQSLWDLQSDYVYELLGENLAHWLQLLQEIRKTRSTFDTTESRQSFGSVTIDYEQVQMKVNSKYDQWQQELLRNFGTRLGNRMREVFVEIDKARRDLEGQVLEASSTAQAVSFITVVQQCKRKVEAWAPEIDLFRQAQTLLTRQRYQFPSDWLFVDQIDDDWMALNDLLVRKVKIVEDQTDALRAKILAEDKIVGSRITKLAVQWTDEKPIAGNIPPEEASASLAAFETRLNQLRSDSEMVSKAKEALDLPDSPDSTLSNILEEVQDFISVWAALSTIWKNLNDLRDTPWTTVQPRKLRGSIDGLIKITKEMPSRMRQYAAFEHMQSVLRQLLRTNPLLADMKSEAVRERHWIKIFKALKPGKRYSQLSMTLGDVWDLQLATTESIIRDIIAQAQGEMALEEFLRQVRENWQNYSLDLVNYQNKCRLIRGWDDLFTKCNENLNSLQAMRHSPYYKEFEDEASSWEDKLNRVHVLFDVWIDVQRQWVYLEGVFTGNADIKHLLPIETSRFQNINSEFFAILKRVYKSPFVLDVLNIAGVQKSLERLAELLNKIQKALGEYLERERISFPRFYFVGDEDLLEIIGNSNDTLRIAKHFRKMFAGLSGLLMDSESNITGFTAKEGEEVQLRKPISLVKIPKINDWLSALENSMRYTLADLLGEAAAMFQSLIESQEINPESLQNYVSSFPAQIVVLLRR